MSAVTILQLFLIVGVWLCWPVFRYCMCVLFEIWQSSSRGITIHPVSIITTEVRPAVEATSFELHSEPSTAVSPLLTVEVYMCDDSDGSWHGDLDVVGMCFWCMSDGKQENLNLYFLLRTFIPCCAVFWSCNSECSNPTLTGNTLIKSREESWWVK